MIDQDDITEVQRACWELAEAAAGGRAVGDSGPVLERMCGLIGRATAVCAIYDEDAARIRLGGTARIDPALIALAARRRDTPGWHPMLRARSRIREGRLDHNARTVDTPALRRSAFHAEFWRPAGLGHAGTYVMAMPGGSVFFASIARRAGADWLNDPEARGTEAMLESLARAVRLGSVMETDRARARLQGATPDAALLVSPRGMLRLANAAAHALIEDGVLRLRRRRIAPAEPRASAAFTRAVEAIAVGARANPLILRAGAGFLHVSFERGPAYRSNATVLVTLRRPRPLGWTVPALARELGLTSREATVALALSTGRGTAGIAEDLGIAPATVRIHLKRLYAKLGVNSQAGLVQRILRDAAN